MTKEEMQVVICPSGKLLILITFIMDRATHNEDLIKGDDIEVHLDHKHMGLAGDDSWSPCVHDKYLIPAVPCSFSIRLSPITPAISGHDIYKSQLQL